jgi:hypothetical protein
MFVSILYLLLLRRAVLKGDDGLLFCFCLKFPVAVLSALYNYIKIYLEMFRSALNQCLEQRDIFRVKE